MKSYSLQLRIWHWLHAITVLGLLGTFFLRKTFLSWRANSEIPMAKLAEYDITVTADQDEMPSMNEATAARENLEWVPKPRPAFVPIPAAPLLH